MKKENRILYRIAVLLLGCLALAVWAADFDSDGMDDSYESFFGLSTNNAVDALLDSDGDSLTNWQESVLWTDPFIPDTDKDGWADGSDSNPLSRAVFRWGDAQFTSNDVYSYTFPAWCSHGFKTDGIWNTNGWTADSSLSSNTGSLNIQVLRELLTNNAVLDVELFDATNSSLFVALCDTNQDVIVSNLYGQSIVTGSQVTVTRRLAIPFASYSNASIVRLWRGTGDITVYGSLMYVDEDGDGLDAAQELQAGTSDSDTDSDDDGLNDFAELMLTHTDPLDTDTDNDGYSDYVEFMAGSNPNLASSLPVSAVSVFGTVNYSGSETGKIYVVAVIASDGFDGLTTGDWGLTRHDELTEPGAYSITNVSVLSSGWIKAWRDSNGNGQRDPWEAQGAYAYNPLYLSHPASNVDVTLVDFRQDYSLPFAETFEAIAGMAGTPGSVNGQHGWNVTGTGAATVQSNTVSGGAQALEITDASVSHEFVDGQTDVWVSYRVKAVRGSAPQNIPTNMAVVFYVNNTGNLCVYSNQQSVTLPVIVPDGWNRFDFHCDYTAKRWDLRFNRERVVSGFPFYGSPETFSSVRLDSTAGANSYMDDIQVVYENPDRDDDGFTNDEETQTGSNPDDAQSLPPVTVSGQITYTGSSTGLIHVVAVASSSVWNPAVSTELTIPGVYSLSGIPALTNIWIKAWLDSDSNGLCDPWEAQDSFVSNPLNLRSPVSGIDLTLVIADEDGDGLDAAEEHIAGTSDTNADTDNDGLTDREEVVQTLSNPLSADTDGDGITDFDEVRVYGTSPLSADTDKDSLPDIWEISNGLCPTNFADCMSDPDGDGFGTVYEYHHGTSWTNGAEYPAVTAAVMPGQKIQDVITAAADYAVIRIEPGTYSGYKNNSLHFDGKQMMLFADAGTVVLDVSGSPMGISFSGSTQDIRTVVNGLIIRNAGQYGVYCRNSGMTLRNCVIGDNGAGTTSGAGFYLSGSSSRLENCVFYGNFSTNGGAIYANNANLELLNCTLMSNRVTGASGTIRFGGTGNTLTVMNSIIWEEGTNPVHLISGTADISYSCIKGGFIGVGNMDVEPRILENGYQLNATSPCIDAGTASGAPAADIAGHERTGAVDIGAWEYNASYADSDGDGYTDFAETGVSDPQNADSLPVNEVEVSGTIDYAGIQSGTIHVVAATDSNDWNSVSAIQLTGPGTYSITNVPVLTNVWIKAWMDSNDNGIRDESEACGETDPLFLRAPAQADISMADPDSDGDGLSDALELNGKLYFVVPGGSTWEQAKGYAAQIGGHLAVITSDVEQRIFLQCVGEGAFTNGSFWIGAEDINGDGIWSWVTGEPFEYTRWAEGYPSTSTTSAALYSRTRGLHVWANAHVGGHYSYLLEYAAVLDPHAADTDSDGLSDLEELRTGSNPVLADTDGDGLSDYDETHVYGTGPAASDTDHDGLSDKDEIQTYGTNPLISDTDGDGLSDRIELSEHSYQLLFEYLRWPEAKAHAEALGGRLAVIANETVQQEIQPFLALDSSRGDYPWGFNLFIGAADSAREGLWKWITGEDLNYTCWESDHPIIDPAASYATVQMNSSNTWINSYSQEYHPALVEYSARLNPLNPDTDGDGIPDGTEFIRGMNPCSLDSDGDGLSDAYEVAAGLNPGVTDTDADGLADPDEISLGTDPLAFDTDGDGLLDGEEAGITLTSPLTASEVTQTASVPGTQTIGRTCPHQDVQYREEDGDLIITSLFYEPEVFYSISVGTAGMHRLALQLEPEGAVSFDYLRYPVEISINDNIIGEMMAVTNRGSLAEGILYTPWLVPGTYEVKCRFKRFDRELRDVRIHALELSAIAGEDSDGNGITDWMQARMGSDVDTDRDGLSDHAEIFTYGTDALAADTDGDGLKDGAELTAGTNLLNADSDGDGITDGVEINEIHTDALVPKFDGTVVNALTMPGSATNSVTGEWHVNGTAIYSESRRGELQYRFTLPTQDMYRVEIEAAHLWNGTLGSSAQTEDTSELDFYVDGLYVGTRELVSMSGTVANVQAFLPVLSPGEHSLNVFWENLNKKLVLKVNELRFQQLGGPDADGDGTKDWVAESLYNSTSVDSSLQSVVSPLCLEGVARYPELAMVSTQSSISTLQSQIPQRGAGDRWFVNVPLNQDGTTDVGISFQNGAFTRAVQAEWVPFNILQNSQTNLIVLAGSSIKLTALPQGWNGGQFTLTLDGQETRSPNCHPLICAFEQPGTYVISGAYRKGNQTTIGQITVTVKEPWSFTGEQPGCMVGRTREWTIPNVPDGIVFETDGTIEMGILDSVRMTNNQSQITVSLAATEVNGEHIMVARAYPGGPILDSAKLSPFWVQSGVDHYMRVVERYADSELWETTAVAKHLPPGVEVLIDVFAAGVMLDDYTIARILTANDFEANGEYTFRLFHPNDREGSTCYRLEVYQDEQQIGEVK